MASDKKISSPLDGLGEGIQKIRALNGRTSGPTRRSTKGQWTPEEDEILRRAVHRFKGKNWKKIAECFKDRTDVQCLHRWQKVLNPELIKGPWSKEEDEIIVELVNKYGPKKWSTISQHLPGRIGKQCRERWHNHLNPSINKEAWTQEEELTLIRAHQIYGNKWAELTKFLPGRTDNSIKNHWNSSVKKKLDSYLKSGMLTQFQGLPQVGQQSQPSSSLKVHNGDDSGHKVTEVEDISECSQDSTNAGRFQSSNEMPNVLLHGEEPLSIEVPGPARELNSSPVTCSDPYYPTLDEPSLSLTDISHDIGFVTKFLQQNFSHDAETSMGSDYPFDLHDMSNISPLELRHESLGIHSHCIGYNESHEGHNVQLQASGELNTSSVEQMMHMGSDKTEHMLISDEECCRILFTEAMKDECFSARNLDLCGDAGPSVCQSSDIQISEANVVAASQMQHPSNSDIAVPACSQSFFSRLISADDDQIILDGDTNHLLGVHDQEYTSCSHDDFIYTNDSANSPCGDGTDEMGLQEHLDTPKNHSKLVPVNSFSSRSETLTCPTDARPSMDMEENGAGALCYEPPRFPSFDIPFFSCDLVQSGGEMQQEYSPLGIRQLMMSSMNCITPFRIWDSPTRGDSPDAVLKSAAKTFTGTPSILKKRHREFLSPLSARRNGKKLETSMTSRLTKDLSRLDVLVDEDSGAQKSSRSPSTNQNRKSADTTEDKENPATTLEDKGIQDQTSQEIRERITINADHNKTKVEVDHTTQKPSGVLVEHNMNDLQLYSPKQLDSKAFGSSAITPRNRHLKSSCRKPCVPFTSPLVSRMTHEVHPTAEPSGQRHDSLSAVPEVNGGNAGADATAENCSVFGETPYKRSIESPSAWKSPWFINSFLAGPKVDTDITVEDIGYFMSPGDRSYDAIGLMKQISEQTAAAYANAQEVLGNETPQSLAKKQRNHGAQENNGLSNQPGNRSNLHQNILTECRVLDFSECGTPAKDEAEPAKSSTGIGFSSPSSYLLKSCR